MSDWQVVGRQRFRVDADLIVWEGAGDISVPEISHIFHAAFGVQQAYGYALVVIEPHEPWSFPPASRKFLSQFHREHQAVGATAIVGISATMIMLINLVLRAIAMLGGRQPPTRFFKERPEALAWIDEQRVFYQNEVRRPKSAPPA